MLCYPKDAVCQSLQSLTIEKVLGMTASQAESDKTFGKDTMAAEREQGLSCVHVWLSRGRTPFSV